MTSGHTQLSTRSTGVLSHSEYPLTVGGLERKLLKAFPACDAEEWDRTGLVCGDPAVQIEAVAVALDPTVEAVRIAADRGANVLVTHHPPFLSAPMNFGPGQSVAEVDGALIWEAVSRGVALMCFHTALDVSVAASTVLPGMLSLAKTDILEPIDMSRSKGYGQVCHPADGQALDLQHLAARCKSVFGRTPRVWGKPSQNLDRIVTATGSASNLVGLCVEHKIDCLVCGEVKYHDALSLSKAGVSIIELGHDVSELPLVAPLAAAVERAGVEVHDIVAIDQGGNWWSPESVRI